MEFIEKQWGNSENFLLSFGLKSYNDEDVEEGKATVKVLMTEDDYRSLGDQKIDIVVGVVGSTMARLVHIGWS